MKRDVTCRRCGRVLGRYHAYQVTPVLAAHIKRAHLLTALKLVALHKQYLELAIEFQKEAGFPIEQGGMLKGLKNEKEVPSEADPTEG